MLTFARRLKPIAAAWGVSEASIGVLKDAVRAWHDEARPPETPFEETWSEFAVAWPKIKTPAGGGRLASDVRLAGDQDAHCGRLDSRDRPG